MIPIWYPQHGERYRCIFFCQLVLLFLGYLQIRFLCTAIRENIRLDKEDDIEFYSGIIAPCLCQPSVDVKCHIYFIKGEKSNVFNHFIPLQFSRGMNLF